MLAASTGSTPEIPSTYVPATTLAQLSPLLLYDVTNAEGDEPRNAIEATANEGQCYTQCTPSLLALGPAQ